MAKRKNIERLLVELGALAGVWHPLIMSIIAMVKNAGDNDRDDITDEELKAGLAKFDTAIDAWRDRKPPETPEN